VLIAATVCPPAPLLVPALAPGAPAAVENLRAHVAAAVADLVAAEPSQVVVVAGADTAGRWGSNSGGTFAAYGVASTSGGPDRTLPLSLTLGAFLLDQADWSGDRSYLAVPTDASACDCDRTGRELAGGPETAALLILGDGSVKRSTAAPGYFDDRAAGFDRTVSKALADGDAEALLHLDAVLTDQLWVSGRAPWQVLAGAAALAQQQGASVTAQLRYDEAPLGVGYLLADWVFSR